MSSPARPFANYISRAPYSASREPILFNEPASPALVWMMLRQLTLPDHGRSLFPPPLGDQNRYWRELCNYVRQARAYWDGAEGTNGSSAALLYYYAFLNLAKAELLITNPMDVYQKAIHHGISYSPTRAQSIKGDILQVRNGIFPLLYRKRVGFAFPSNQRLEIPRLLSAVPEIGHELGESGIGTPASLPFYHASVGNNTHSWSLVAVTQPGFLRDPAHVTTRRFLQSYAPVDFESVGEWRSVFSISHRTSPIFVDIYQSIPTFSTQGQPAEPDWGASATFLPSQMAEYLSDTISLDVDGVFNPSLLKSRALPMTSGLARYALMFYVSSLVRYKPSALDPDREAAAAWLLDSFSKEAALGLLVDALSGILQKPVRFGEGHRP